MSRWRASRRVVVAALLVALVVEVAAIAWLVLNPSAAVPTTVVTRTSDWLARHGVPGPIADGDVVEFVLNAGMFVPLGATLKLLAPRVPWWAWTAVGFAVSGAIELTQWMLLEDRSESWRDVWANTLGLGLGAAVVAAAQVALRLTKARRNTRLAVL